MQHQQKILDIFRHPYQLDEQTFPVLKKLVADYPYCQSLQILLAKNLQTIDKLEFEKQVNKASAYAIDRRKFQRYISDRDKPNVTGVTEEQAEVEVLVDSSENPSEARPETITSQEEPAQTPPEIPQESPQEIPEEKPSETPEEIPKKEPDETPTRIPRIVPPEPPKVAPSRMPFPHDVPKPPPSEIPYQRPSEYPGITPAEVPGKRPPDFTKTSPSAAESPVTDSAPGKQPAPSQNIGLLARLKKHLGIFKEQQKNQQTHQPVSKPPVTATATDIPTTMAVTPVETAKEKIITVIPAKEPEMVLPPTDMIADLPQDSPSNQQQNGSSHLITTPVVSVVPKPRAAFTELERLAQKPDINHLIEKFLKEEPRIQVRRDLPETQEDLSAGSAHEDPQLVTETLAQVYLKQGNKVKALEIYEKLCLKFPEKSSYFAKKIIDIKNEITK